MRKSVIKRVLWALFILLVCAVVLFPFVMMLSTSLKSLTEIRTAQFSLIPREVRWDNYASLWSTGKWALYFRNSILITVLSTVTAVFVNSMAGFAFARLRFRGRNLMFALTMLGMIVPGQVLMLPAYVILKYIPFAGGNNWLGQGGAGFLNSYAGLILIYLSGSMGVFLYRQFLLSFPIALDDAAKIDGLSRFGCYLRIYLPLSMPAIATMTVIRATATWNDYMWPLLMTQKDNMYTVQLALSRFINNTGNQWHYIMAATAVIILPILALFLCLQRYFVEGITTAGIKG